MTPTISVVARAYRYQDRWLAEVTFDGTVEFRTSRRTLVEALHVLAAQTERAIDLLGEEGSTTPAG